MTSTRKKTLLMTCRQCSKEFMACKSDARTYCSAPCYSKSRDRNVECICQHCGGTFKVARSVKAHGRGKYCNRDCAGFAASKRWREAKK